MLCVTNYPREYVDECRSSIEAQLTAYQSVLDTTAECGGSIDSAAESFASLYFNSLVVVLDRAFVHRSRVLERKDGNPMNEVRMLCNSILEHRAVLTADKTIKYKAEKAVLTLQIGDPIRLTKAEFERLFRAFFAEIEATFV